jgi:hypothetical protein
MLQTWVLSYFFTPNGFIDLNTTASLMSPSQFSLTITVGSGFSL